MTSKSGMQALKIAPTTIKTICCAGIGHQNCSISCLCSNVWQMCNVKVACNVLVETFDYCTYLKCSEIWCAKCRTSMRNEHVNNGSEMQCILAKSLNRCSAKITRNFLNLKKNFKLGDCSGCPM